MTVSAIATKVTDVLRIITAYHQIDGVDSVQVVMPFSVSQVFDMI